MFTNAIVRKPGKNFAMGLTSHKKKAPSYELVVKQHEDYIRELESVGFEVTILEPLENFPDAWFVEDTAVVTPEIAVITNPGAESRNGEKESIATALADFRRIVHLKTPGTLDGGDVLMVGTHFFIGISQRTNREGAAQLGHILEEYGYTWAMVPVVNGLHFKSSVNYLGRDTLLMTKDYTDLQELRGYKKIIAPPEESAACNILPVNDRLMIPGGFPLTRKKIESLKIEIIELDMSEAQKMDGGLTCLSIRF